MRLFRDTITLQTGQSQEFIDITKHVRDVIARSEIRDGPGIATTIRATRTAIEATPTPTCGPLSSAAACRWRWRTASRRSVSTRA